MYYDNGHSTGKKIAGHSKLKAMNIFLRSM